VSKVESKVESVSSLKGRIIAAIGSGQLSKSEIAAAIGKHKVDGQLHTAVSKMLRADLIEYTIPDKPNSRLQKYRLTSAGKGY